MKNKSPTVTATINQINQGVLKCIENAIRLVNCASILLGEDDNAAPSFVLWSHGVEEFGKAMLLREEVKNAKSKKEIATRINFNHTEKFSKGIKELFKYPVPKILRRLNIKINISLIKKPITDPLGRKSLIHVARYCTGSFLDELNGIDLTEKLREKFSYVDWDQKTNSWVKPEETFFKSNLNGKWEFADEELQSNKTNTLCFKKAINLLQEQLELEKAKVVMSITFDLPQPH